MSAWHGLASPAAGLPQVHATRVLLAMAALTCFWAVDLLVCLLGGREITIPEGAARYAESERGAATSALSHSSASRLLATTVRGVKVIVVVPSKAALSAGDISTDAGSSPADTTHLVSFTRGNWRHWTFLSQVHPRSLPGGADVSPAATAQKWAPSAGIVAPAPRWVMLRSPATRSPKRRGALTALQDDSRICPRLPGTKLLNAI